MTTIPGQRASVTESEPAYQVTLQHIQLLQDRQKKLAAAQEQAEHQVLHHYGSGYRCGDITIAQLLAFFEAYTALETPRRSRRWNEHIDIAYQTCHLMQTPNGPEGTWIGSWPCSEAEPYPVRGVAVVYVLFDANNQPCYVGSTNQFRTRMGKHVASPQPTHCHDVQRSSPVSCHRARTTAVAAGSAFLLRSTAPANPDAVRRRPAHRIPDTPHRSGPSISPSGGVSRDTACHPILHQSRTDPLPPCTRPNARPHEPADADSSGGGVVPRAAIRTADHRVRHCLVRWAL
ncbi:GIY-YIG nuclease family protein [Streptomyces lydicus]|uniref:GIY-YIG nuclease family protein n=1 Tax=Streptomyces lydicus TaxID=47763 RepID=UPI0036F6108E